MKTMMRWVLVLLLAAAFPAFAQNAIYNGSCTMGGTQAQTSGMKSSNYQLSNFPSCQVNVYYHGGTTRAVIYSDSLGTPLANPFTAGANGLFNFYAAQTDNYDVTMTAPGMTTTTIPNVSLVNSDQIAPVASVPLNKTSGLTPNNMPEFQIVSSYRQFAEIGKTYFDHPLTDGTKNVSFVSNQSGGDLGFTGCTTNGCQVTPTVASQTQGFFYERKRPTSPFETATLIITKVPKATGTGSVTVDITAQQNTSNFMNAEYDINQQKMRMVIVKAGVQTVLGEAAATSPLESGDKFSFVLDGPYIYALQTKLNGQQYRSGLVNAKPYFNPREIGFLQLFEWGFGANINGSGNIALFRDFNVSYFGGLGLRDYDWVKYEDGTPFQEEGKFFFTATLAGWNDQTEDAPIQGAYMGTFSFDPVTFQIKQVGRILFKDDLAGAQLVVGEHAGQLIFDRDYKYWIVSATSFGSFDLVGIEKPVASIQYDAPLVGTHIVNANVIDLSVGIGSSCSSYTNKFWDVYWTKMTNPTTHAKEWKIAATVQLASPSISVPGLFTAPDGSPFSVSGGTCVVQSNGLSREGTKIVNTGNGVYSIVAGETNTTPSTVYTYSLYPFTQIGSFQTPLDTSIFGSPAQHFDIIENYNKGLTEYFALLFGTDSYQSVPFTWGTTMVAMNAFSAELNGYAVNKVKVSTRSDDEVQTDPYTGIDSMAGQNASSIAITGGTMSGVKIGTTAGPNGNADIQDLVVHGTMTSPVLHSGGTNDSSFFDLYSQNGITLHNPVGPTTYFSVGPLRATTTALVTTKSAPVAHTDACSPGDAWDAVVSGTAYHYYCIATGNIVRVAMASF